MRRTLVGTCIGVLSVLALSVAMLPLRNHLSITTSALVLVVPVVLGVASGGFIAGLTSVAAGFLIYDLVFIPPYWTLAVGDAEHWVALVVYVLVMVVVAWVVAHLEEARSASQARATNARLLFDLSEILLGDRSISELSQAIVDEMCRLFALDGADLLLSLDGHLESVATSGSSVAKFERGQLHSLLQAPMTLNHIAAKESIQTLALVAADRPIGLLLLHGLADESAPRELLPTLANHLALALERAQLRERALLVELLEEIDRLRRALLGAVSHDLRTPLATIKVASSALLDPATSLPVEDIQEMYQLIDMQTDRLTRLVSNLLDMTRIQTGVLEVRREPWSLSDLVHNIVDEIRPSLETRLIEIEIPPDLPDVDVDYLLIQQVLFNLIDNAHRHGPIGTPIVISAASSKDAHVAISVADSGPGVPPQEKTDIFETFVRFDTGGRAGLGLAIAKAFVDAHDGTIWVDDPAPQGARFTFTLPRRTTARVDS